MIVRLSGEGQYELADGEQARLNELERAVLDAVEHDREGDFAPAWEALLAHVRRGRRIDEDELTGSDVILPPPDTTFAEAGRELSGEGLIPD